MSEAGGRSRARRAILVRREGVALEDVSRGGCRLAASHPLHVGAIGVLRVPIDGEIHVEVFRVCRSGVVEGTPGRYEAGLEFLPMPARSRSLHDFAAQLDQPAEPAEVTEDTDSHGRTTGPRRPNGS